MANLSVRQSMLASLIVAWPDSQPGANCVQHDCDIKSDQEYAVCTNPPGLFDMHLLFAGKEMCLYQWSTSQ